MIYFFCSFLLLVISLYLPNFIRFCEHYHVSVVLIRVYLVEIISTYGVYYIIVSVVLYAVCKVKLHIFRLYRLWVYFQERNWSRFLVPVPLPFFKDYRRSIVVSCGCCPFHKYILILLFQSYHDLKRSYIYCSSLIHRPQFLHHLELERLRI